MIGTTPAGKRDRRVTFYSQGATKTPRGAMVQGVGDEIARVWAFVNYGRAAERRQAGVESSTSAATARVLASPAILGVDSSCTAEMDGATWDVTSNVPWGRGERDITMIRRQ